MIASRGWLALAVGAVAVGAAGCKNSSKTPPISSRSALADSANQVMYGARFNLTDQGVMHAQLVADTAYFFDDNTRVELIHVNTTFYTTTGVKNAVLTSRRGTYHTATGMMLARGDVVVNSEDGRRLRSEELKYDQTHNEISTDSAFAMTGPDRSLQGIGFRSDPNLQNIHVLKTLAGTAGAITIPNQ
ncbi:MAG: LPS export ABC transporter periplasmic protein LptC [Gemmatimonadota bacterium]|nr:LPS export ABC transporter periplasmic protein LptC [Gemmatimonadota bacterium]